MLKFQRKRQQKQKEKTIILWSYFAFQGTILHTQTRKDHLNNSWKSAAKNKEEKRFCFWKGFVLQNCIKLKKGLLTWTVIYQRVKKAFLSLHSQNSLWIFIIINAKDIYLANPTHKHTLSLSLSLSLHCTTREKFKLRLR